MHYFGRFSPTDTNLILREFEKCGVILKHVPGPQSANWMHILYQVIELYPNIMSSMPLMPIPSLVYLTLCLLNACRSCISFFCFFLGGGVEIAAFGWRLLLWNTFFMVYICYYTQRKQKKDLVNASCLSRIFCWPSVQC